MPTTIYEYSNARLQPAQFPEDARTDAAAFEANLTLAAGTVLGKVTATNKLKAYSNGAGDGSETAVAILMYDIKTDANGKVFLGDSATGSYQNLPFMGSTVYVAGTFDTSELTGWDSNALADFNARVLPNGFVRIP